MLVQQFAGVVLLSSMDVLSHLYSVALFKRPRAILVNGAPSALAGFSMSPYRTVFMTVITKVGQTCWMVDGPWSGRWWRCGLILPIPSRLNTRCISANMLIWKTLTYR